MAPGSKNPKRYKDYNQFLKNQLESPKEKKSGCNAPDYTALPKLYRTALSLNQNARSLKLLLMFDKGEENTFKIGINFYREGF